MPDQPKPEDPQSFVSQAMAATERVQAALTTEFQRTPQLDWLLHRLGGMVHFAAQKLIDMKAGGAPPNALDEATIISCSRLFNSCYSGYELLKRGLILDALVLLRSVYELTTQAEAFFERPELAQRWLEGARVEQRDVRQVSPLAMSSKQLYSMLARHSHPNVVASAYHVTPIHGGTALAYGGAFRPKGAGQLACQFLWAEMTFLDIYYRHNSDRLKERGVLWRAETYDAVKQLGSDPEVSLAAGWDPVLAVLRAMLETLTGHFNDLPDDSVVLAQGVDLERQRTPPSGHGDED